MASTYSSRSTPTDSTSGSRRPPDYRSAKRSAIYSSRVHPRSRRQHGNRATDWRCAMSAAMQQAVSDAIEYLVTLAREGTRPAEAKARLQLVRARHPETSMKLVWEEE